MTDNLEPSTKKVKQNDPIDALVDDSTRTSNSDVLKEANEALQESNRIHVRPIVDETSLGIELFVGNKVDEFHGLIKSRYADFIVHEIDNEGKIAQLTSLEAPEEKQVKSAGPSLSDLVDSDAFECISEVNNGYLTQFRIDVTGMDKDTRTSLHHAIRESFDRCESSTLSESEMNRALQKAANGGNKTEDKDVKPDSTQQVEESTNQDEKVETTQPDVAAEANNQEKPVDRKYIIVTRRNKISRAKNVWPRDRPDHTHFILYKENKDTMDAIHNLAAACNVRPSNFAFAGTKDRRAVTSQWLSSWRLEPKRLIAASRRFNKCPFIKVGNFCFKKDQLKLGQLKANKFDIVIRHLVYNKEGIQIIEKAMNSIKDKGFVNYFGLQRFGTRSIQTHEIGLAILQTKWEKAVELILSYRFDDNMQPPLAAKDGEPTASDPLNTSEVVQKNGGNSQQNQRKSNGAEQHNSFIDLWKSKLDAEIVFKKYPHFRYTNEGIIMKCLSKSEDSSRDYLNALVSLPRNTRSMYVHSYQSLLWNKLTTYRLKKYGFKVIPGDLILSSDSNISDNSLDILLSADEVDPNEEQKTKNTEADSSVSNHKAPVEELESKIVVATEENLEKYSIFDVVLPIVGSRVRIPANDVGKELERLLANDNLSLESFRAREKLFISYGSYRKIMVKPSNVNWSLKQYSNPYQNLIDTDLDRLNREMSSREKEGGDQEERPASPPKSDSSDEALLVTFELPPSCYATMCLREIMKKSSTEINGRF